MVYNPWVDEIVKMFHDCLDWMNPKKQLFIPSDAKKSRLAMFSGVALLIAFPMVGGLLLFLKWFSGAGLWGQPVGLAILLILCILSLIASHLLRKSSKLTEEKAYKWWRGESSFWKG